MSPLSDAMSALYFVSGVDHVMFHHTGISHGQMRKWWLCYSRAYGLVVVVMDHDYSLASIEVPVKRKRPYSDTRRLCDKRRNKTRINIGQAFTRWRELRENLGLDRDSALASVLIDR